MKAERVIKDALKENPELRLVLEIAARTRNAEVTELPRDIGMATETVSSPVNSAYLGSPETHPAY